MRKAIAAAIALLFSGTAHAADLPRRPPPPVQPVVRPLPFSWTGFYIGVNGGWGQGRSRFNFDDLGVNTGHFGTSGWLGGATMGYNLQTGPLVVGLESDIDWANLSGSTACPISGLTCQTQNDWLGTVRGRVGVAFDRVLPYVTGGLAVGDINASIPSVGSATQTNAGWAVGGGLEYALTNNWSTKVEYLHVDLGSFDCTTCSATPPVNVRLNEDIVRGGINYKFNWGN